MICNSSKIELECTCSVRAVWVACRLHWLCSVVLQCNCSVQTCAVHTVVCSVSELYLQPPLHSMYWSVSAVCTAKHCRYTAVWSGRPHFNHRSIATDSEQVVVEKKKNMSIFFSHLGLCGFLTMTFRGQIFYLRFMKQKFDHERS